MYPWEIYWLIDAKTVETPERRALEGNARAYDMLQAAREGRLDEWAEDNA